MKATRVIAMIMSLMAAPALADMHVFVVSGLGGEEEYERKFAEQARSIAESAVRTVGDESKVVLLTGNDAQRNRLQRELGELAKRVTADDQVFVVLIGHGSFDGEEYRLNLPGPDITGSELGALLDRLPARQQLLVNTTSASGAVVDRWKRPGRIVITATRSGGERNATRFPEFWARALSSAEADVDKDEVITAAEAFEFASRQVADAFKADVALVTEHARLEGENPGRFTVARLGGTAAFAGDAELKVLLDEQSGIVRQLDALRDRKTEMDESHYYDELEKVLVALARVDQRIAAREASLSAKPRGEADVSKAP